jgi:hypothetical protein
VILERRPREGRSGSGRAEREEADQTARRFEAQHRRHVRIVGVEAGHPHAGVAQEVRGVQHVHRRRAGRQQLLDLGDLVVGFDLGADSDDQGRALNPGAIFVDRRRRVFGIALLDGFGHAVGPFRLGVATDDDEAPRPQAAMVRRPQASVEDDVEIGATGGRLHERARRLAVQKKVQGRRRGDRTVEGMSIS